MEFKDKLYNLRYQMGLTQHEAADLCGFSSGCVISHFESGEREPSLKNFIKLCKGLECDPNDLIDV